jgi:hypothetical protein
MPVRSKQAFPPGSALPIRLAGRARQGAGPRCAVPRAPVPGASKWLQMALHFEGWEGRPNPYQCEPATGFERRLAARGRAADPAESIREFPC